MQKINIATIDKCFFEPFSKALLHSSINSSSATDIQIISIHIPLLLLQYIEHAFSWMCQQWESKKENTKTSDTSVVPIEVLVRRFPFFFLAQVT